MKKLTFILICILCYSSSFAQGLSAYHKEIQQYEPSEEYPFGIINPKAPSEVAQFDFMVGICDCTDSIPQGPDKWLSFPSIWRAKYFLNGYGIQDNNFNRQNPTSNLRLFDKQTQEWKVTYISNAQAYSTGEWVGKKENGDIVLYRKNGDDQPYSRLTFYNIREEGYDWKSETVLPSGEVRPGWKKNCIKR